MKYIDLHCDALTSNEGVLQVTRGTLAAGDCLVQCFAAFVSERRGRFSAALALCDRFDALCNREGYNVLRKYSDLEEDEINALLTVEEGGAIEGDIGKLEALYKRGVRMMTLTWNYPNEIGFPNFRDYEGVKSGRASFSARETRGLTQFGFAAVERMAELKMLADVSHGSDGVFEDVAMLCGRKGVPFVASHSGATEVLDCARNLTDKQIRKLADCGGVVGLDFCADFLSPIQTAQGQRDAILAHAEHILSVGGEDVLALGSDFDGIPENAYVKNPSRMPKLLEEFERAFGTRVAEKIAFKNAQRILIEAL